MSTRSLDRSQPPPDDAPDGATTRAPIDVWVTRPRRRALSVAGAFAGIIGILVLAGVWNDGRHSVSEWFGYYVLACIAAICSAAVFVYRSAGGEHRMLTTDRTAILLRGPMGVRRIERTRIESALVVRSGSVEKLGVVLIGGERMEISFSRSGEAAGVLEAVGLDGARERTRLRLYTPGAQLGAFIGGGLIGSIPGGLAGFFVGAIVASVTRAPMLGLACGTVLTLLSLWGGGKVLSMLLPEITVGADGVAWEGTTTSATQFACFDQFVGIAVVPVRVRSGGWSVELTLKGGRKYELGSFDTGRKAEAFAVVERLERAWKAWNEAEAGRLETTVFESSTSSTAEWLAHLKKLASTDSSYRSNALTRGQLIELVENPTSPMRQRVGAAVVLRARGDDEARARIRIAAQASADDRVRVAFSSLADHEIEAAVVEEALAVRRAE
ncbi:MAG: hypothetical protein HOW73_40685 [Polyangiaceae bacterium]|nr:hypothetical protein [Polyangiaceae bacterium]